MFFSSQTNQLDFSHFLRIQEINRQDTRIGVFLKMVDKPWIGVFSLYATVELKIMVKNIVT